MATTRSTVRLAAAPHRRVSEGEAAAAGGVAGGTRPARPHRAPGRGVAAGAGAARPGRPGPGGGPADDDRRRRPTRDTGPAHRHPAKVPQLAGDGGGGEAGVESLHRGRVERGDVDVGDEGVHPADDVLGVAEEVLVELLAGPEAGVDDVDVPAGLCDEPAGDVVDEHRLAHVEHQGFAGGAAGRQVACLESAGSFWPCTAAAWITSCTASWTVMK